MEVIWLERPGDSFANDLLSELDQGFDIISYDHPFVGSAASSGALLPLDGLLSPKALEDLALDSMGPSHVSYSWRGQQWGLAADVACQVSVFRPDLLPEADLPHTWNDALALASAMHGRVTTSLVSHDAICSLLTLCANRGTPIVPTPERFADPDVALPALEWMARYTEHCHVSAWDGYVVQPMATSNEIVYGLLQWGYMDRALATAAPARLRFVDIPSSGKGPIGATLGGAGLGISSSCREPAQAAAYCAWVTGKEAQRDIVFKFGGNPGSRAVWDDSRLDEEVGGFFSGTRASLENASIRPRDEWWPKMGRFGGEALARGLRAGESPERLLAELEKEYHAARI